jgi:hypothetical protein
MYKSPSNMNRQSVPLRHLPNTLLLSLQHGAFPLIVMGLFLEADHIQIEHYNPGVKGYL